MEHSHHLIMGIITGMLFGFTLFKVGAVRYSRVEGLLLLRDLKIMKFAFTGIATASIIYGLADILGFAESTNLIPRIMPYMGVAHLIGGVMFGIAMASAGFCPGTCVARVGAGKFISAAGIIGLVLGIVIYNAIQPTLVEAGILGSKQDLTLYGVLGIPYGPLAVAWGVLFLILALVADWLDPAKKFYIEENTNKSLVNRLIKSEWHWAVGGVAAGSIIALATAQGEYLGFSGALLALVAWIGDSLGHPLSNVVPKLNETIYWHSGLIIGVLPGAFIASIISGKFKFDPVPPAFAQVTPLPIVRMILVFFAGIFLALGAMIGGGCTTGAFLAAYPTLSIGSMAMSATYFIVGILTANLIYLGRWSRFIEAKKASEELYD